MQEVGEHVEFLKLECEETRHSAITQVEGNRLELANTLDAAAASEVSVGA